MSGVATKAVSELLGHASPAIILKSDAHTMLSMEEDDGAPSNPLPSPLDPLRSCDFESIFGGSVETWLTRDTLDEADRDGAMP